MDGYYCNSDSCGRLLEGHIWVTHCFHVFCQGHGLNAREKTVECPKCLTKLKCGTEVVDIDISNMNNHENIWIVGRNPEETFKIALKSITFLYIQKGMYTKRIRKELEECKDSKIRTELHRTKEELEKCKRVAECYKSSLLGVEKKLDNMNASYNRLKEKFKKGREKKSSKFGLFKHHRLEESADIPVTDPIQHDKENDRKNKTPQPDLTYDDVSFATWDDFLNDSLHTITSNNQKETPKNKSVKGTILKPKIASEPKTVNASEDIEIRSYIDRFLKFRGLKTKSSPR